MDTAMPDEKAIAAAIVGELLPEREYAAPLLLDRFEKDEQLVLKAPPTDLGFGTGAVDSVLLEFFKALVPYVQAALSYGILTVVQDWLIYGQAARNHAAQVAQLNGVLAQNVALAQTIAAVAALIERREGAPVAVDDVVKAIVDAVSRLGGPGNPP
jgi:hypothetical protein